MLTKAGPKLLDFGLAKLRLAADVAGADVTAATDTAPLRRNGMVLGTPQYMAPEQLEGGEADARTDLFAFGAILFEMITGRKAFEGHSHPSLIGAILKDDPPPLSALQPLAPLALERLVGACLAKDPDDRWQSAGASSASWAGYARTGRRLRRRGQLVTAGRSPAERRSLHWPWRSWR